MNFYSHAAAYSLYPRGTFERRFAVSCHTRDDVSRRQLLEAKYAARGWNIVGTLPDLYMITMHTPKSVVKTDFLLAERIVGDASTWVIPFPDLAEVLLAAFPDERLPAAISIRHCDTRGHDTGPCPQPIYRDPAILNSFNFTYHARSHVFQVRFDTVRDGRFASRLSWIKHKQDVCFTVSLGLSRRLQENLRRCKAKEYVRLGDNVMVAVPSLDDV